LRDVVLLHPAAQLDLAPLLGRSVDPGPGPDPDDAATIVFTSGSTASPKGVVHTHAALCLAAEGDATVLGIDPDDRTWGYLPFFFAGGLVAVALATLSRGGGGARTFDRARRRALAAERQRCSSPIPPG
jgi:long-subunit acyl-CoA synthetase (AMP-forming)